MFVVLVDIAFVGGSDGDIGLAHCCWFDMPIVSCPLLVAMDSVPSLAPTIRQTSRYSLQSRMSSIAETKNALIIIVLLIEWLWT